VAERLAVSLASILEHLPNTQPEQITIAPEWLCLCHKELAGGLFPDWAGRFRDMNVQVGAHTPPPFYEVPVQIRLYCDDLAERLRHIRPRHADFHTQAELLAWADGRFQAIHPFKDFNGRIGRILLSAILYKLALPHVVTAPSDAEERRRYLDALQAADAGDIEPLQLVWFQRLLDAL